MVKRSTSTAHSAQLLSMEKHLKSTASYPELLKEIANAPFTDRLLCADIDLGIVVLLFVNAKKQTVDRVALSETELAKGATRVSAKPFNKIHIPLSAKSNSIVEAIKTGNYVLTQDWNTLFTPVLTPQQARRNQQGASIECSLVWPLKTSDGGALIFSFYQPMENLNDEHLAFAKSYSSLVEKFLNNSV